MSRPIPHNRSHPPSLDVLQTWTPFAEPFTAPNGLTVTFPDSVEAMFAIGDHFANALESRTYAEFYATKIARGEIQIYAVGGPDGLMSCGELKVHDGKLVVHQDRAEHNRPGSPETGAAVAAFADAVNEGRVRTHFTIDREGFEETSPARTP